MKYCRRAVASASSAVGRGGGTGLRGLPILAFHFQLLVEIVDQLAMDALEQNVFGRGSRL